MNTVGSLSRVYKKVNDKQKIGLDKLLHIPDKCTRLSIDVGTAIDAPNAAQWLLNDDDVFVIGIEPNPECVKVLEKGRNPDFHLHYLNLKEDCIMYKGKKVKDIKGRFQLLHCAIDNVEGIQRKTFFQTDSRNIGCSSLCKPTDKLGLDYKETYVSLVCSLETIIDNLDLERFKFISFLKTDAQGKDYDIVISLGDYIEKTALIQSEVYTYGQYENEVNQEDFVHYLSHHNFQINAPNIYDFVCVNKNLALTSKEVRSALKLFKYIET